MRRGSFLPLVGIVLSLALIGCQKNQTSFKTGTFYLSVDSEPRGARIYQYIPISDQRVLLGTTPFENQPVMVLKSFKGTSGGPGNPMEMMAELGRADIGIEKDGYQPLRALLAVGTAEKPVHHTLTLEPDGEDDAEP